MRFEISVICVRYPLSETKMWNWSDFFVDIPNLKWNFTFEAKFECAIIEWIESEMFDLMQFKNTILAKFPILIEFAVGFDSNLLCDFN